MIRKLLRAAGLVSRGELDATLAKLDRVRQKLEAAQQQLSTAAAAAAEQQHSQATHLERYQQQLSALEASRDRDVGRAQQAAAKAGERVAQLEQELEKRNAQLAEIAREATELEGRVTASVRDLEVAREQLMAMEMRLNLLEGAANTLDLRLRNSSPSAPDGKR